MLKKPITFEDLDGNERTEVFHFHLSKSDVAKLEISFGEGGFVEALKRITKTKDVPLMLKMFEELISRSYGVRSEDGQKFYKSPELYKEFQAHPAYDALFMELMTDASASIVFINGIIPTSVQYSGPELQALMAKTPEQILAELEKSPEQLARERSEAQLQGHRAPSTSEPKRIADPVLEPPAVPSPTFQAPPTQQYQGFQQPPQEFPDFHPLPGPQYTAPQDQSFTD